MSSPQQMISELVAFSVISVQTVITWGILAIVPNDRYDVMEWTLLTFLGATGSAAACFCLNTRPELRRLVIGRCLVAMLFGVVATRVASMSHPTVMSFLNDPLIRIGAGASFGFMGWILSKAVFQRAQERAEAFAHMIVQAGERRLAQQVALLVADKAATVAEPLAKKVEFVAAALAEKKDNLNLTQHLDVTVRSADNQEKQQ